MIKKIIKLKNPSLPTVKDWYDIQNKIIYKYNLENLYGIYNPKERHLSIDLISVAPSNRGKNKATEAMISILEWADYYKIIVTLTPSSDFKSSKKRLTLWYKKLGFVLNKKPNKFWGSQDTMVYHPRDKEKEFRL